MPKTALPPQQGMNNGADLQRELLYSLLNSNSYLAVVNKYIMGLPAYIDDAERDFGTDIYTRMMNDPIISSSLLALKVKTLSEGPRFLPGAKPPNSEKPDAQEEAKYAKATEICGAVEKMLDNLQQPIEEILGEVMAFLPYGNCVAEKVYEVRGGLLALSKLRVKPRNSYGFAITPYMDLAGLVANKIGQVSSIILALDVSPEQIIPREKFLLLTHAPSCGDPRGTSLLRPAYNGWYLKQQTWPQYLKFLSQFATPSIVGKLPPDAADVEVVDANGSATTDSLGAPMVITAAEAMLAKLIAFANGTAIVLENGAEFDLIQSQGDGTAYIKAFDLYDRQMTRAILINARATMEAEHGSKADSETAQDVFEDFTQFIRRQIEIAFYRDVIKPTVRYNWGEDIANELCPVLSLSKMNRENVPEFLNAIANLARSQDGMIHPSMYPSIDEISGLTRDYQAQMLELQDKALIAQDKNAMLQGLAPVG